MPGLMFALAMLVSAQSPPAEGDPIVVTGTRETREQVRSFIKGITVETEDQIAVFADNVCPFATGLPPAHNEVIVRRVRKVAADAGIPVAKEGCRPNLTVIVAADGRGFLKHLRKERPTLFPEMTRREREALENGPVRAWQTIELRRADGGPVEMISFLEVPGEPPKYIPGGAYVVPDVANSRIRKSTRRDLSRSFVVFDLDAIRGMTLAQVADYAAMRTLARTKPGRGERSILGLFDKAGGAPAAELTRWDAAYLKSLYATSNTLAASQQRKNMGKIVREELTEDGGTD